MAKMMKSKSKSMSSKQFVHGGSNKMAGKMSAGTQKPGQSAQMGRGGGKFASGGKTKMFGKQTAKPSHAC